ncbi:unnamed protein product [Chrysoparadoxa australica]
MKVFRFQLVGALLAGLLSVVLARCEGRSRAARAGFVTPSSLSAFVPSAMAGEGSGSSSSSLLSRAPGGYRTMMSSGGAIEGAGTPLSSGTSPIASSGGSSKSSAKGVAGQENAALPLHLSILTPLPPSTQASVGGSVFNLAKNIVGSGILALPGGLAAFSHAKGAVVPGVALTAALGGLSAYCFSLIGRTCNATGALTYGEAWAKTVDKRTSWLPSFSCTSKALFACTAYSIILGDLAHDLAKTFGAPALLMSRNNSLLALSSVFLLPLCLLKNLGPLSYTSIVGIAGSVYTAGVMALRYYDGSYAPGGRFYEAIAASQRGTFSGSAALTPMALLLVSMLATSFIAHYNAPKFYHELEEKSVPKFNKVVFAGYGSAIILCAAMLAYPFLTFGGNSMGLILNNYATTDVLATFCRLAIGFSILCGYPLTFQPSRDGIFDALGIKNASNNTVRLATVLMLAVFTATGMVLRDLGFVVAFGGAILGSAVIYIFPALMWIRKCKMDVKAGKPLAGWRKAEYVAQYGVVGLGATLGALGAGLSVLKTFVW